MIVMFFHRQLITSVVDWCSTAMPSNVEIKARVSDFSQFAEKAAVLSQSKSVHIRQHDTFFNCINGRLKLRDFMVHAAVYANEIILEMSST